MQQKAKDAAAAVVRANTRIRAIQATAARTLDAEPEPIRAVCGALLGRLPKLDAVPEANRGQYSQAASAVESLLGKLQEAMASV
eukprot:10354583-Lingulodinium_polyedra.AAC.1